MIDITRDYIADFLSWLGLTGDVLYEVTHWCLLVVSLLFSLLCGVVASCIFRPVIHKLVEKSPSKIDDLLLNDYVLRAACRIVPAVVFLVLAPLCFENKENKENNELMYVLIVRLSEVYLTVMVLSLITHILNNVSNLSATHDKLRNHYVVGLVQFLKLVFYSLGVIVIVAIVIDRSPISLIAGLGAAATVMMLLFRDSIVGLVAGIQLNVNDMLKPGDWITVKKLGVDGYVQKVSLTTVKIRNFDNTIATVPPSILVTDSFMNWKEIGTRGRRVKRVIYIDVSTVRFCSTEELEAYKGLDLVTRDEIDMGVPIVNLTVYRRFIKSYLKRHSVVNTDDWLMVRQLEHTQNGLPIELYFYFRESDFVRYEELAAVAMEYIIASAAQFKVRLYQAPSGSDLAGLTRSAM